MAVQTRFCTNCGTAVNATARFCYSCGNALSSPDAAQPTEPMVGGVAELEGLLRDATRDEYEIEELIGRGGMAAVFRARDLSLDRPVAIKILPPELTFGSGVVERFRREARTAAKLNHPNIIPIFKIGQAGPTLFFVMKLVEGRTLEEIMGAVGPMEAALVQAIVAQICAPVDYAHRRGIIHRDMKPSNVMIDEEGYAVVMDFGIAKASDSLAITATGAALGTPFYMSPEQTGGKAVTAASDQYSVAVMAYQMFAGRRPFDGETAQEVMAKHLFQEAPPLANVRPDVPALCAAVHRAMAKEPSARFPTIAHFADALSTTAAAQDENTLRTQMIALSRTGSVRKSGGIVTPLSPIPKSRLSTPTAPPPRISGEAPTRPLEAPAATPPPAAETAATIPAPAPSGEPAEPERGPPRRGTLAVGVTVLILTGAGIGFFATQRAGQPDPAPAPSEDSLVIPDDAATTPAESVTAVEPVREPPPREPAVASEPAPARRDPTAAQRQTTPAREAADDRERARLPPPLAVPDVRVPVITPRLVDTSAIRPEAADSGPARRAPPGELQIANAVDGLVVSIDGRRVELAEGRIRLPPGTYRVLLSAPGYEPREREITLNTGSIQILSGVLRRRR